MLPKLLVETDWLLAFARTRLGAVEVAPVKPRWRVRSSPTAVRPRFLTRRKVGVRDFVTRSSSKNAEIFGRE